MPTLFQMAKMSWTDSPTSTSTATSSKLIRYRNTPRKQAKLEESEEHPCPGLTADEDARIAQYLNRTGALGGGGPSLTHISSTRFGRKFSSLSSAQKEQVRVIQSHKWRWRNNSYYRRVYSTSCSKISPPGTESACHKCKALLRLNVFRTTLSIRQPEDKNYKYLNKVYRNRTLAEIYGRCKGLREIMEASETVSRFLIYQDSGTERPYQDPKTPCLRYVQGVLSGRFKGDNVFSGLMLSSQR